MRRSVSAGANPSHCERPASGRLRRPWPWLAAGLLASLTGCSTPEQPGEPEADDSIVEVPVPPANGPKLLALAARVTVRDRPSPKGTVIGELQAGGQVARATDAYSTRGCPGGWYPVRPRGFVCAGAEATTDASAPAAKLLTGPDLAAPLPYRYGQVVGGAAVSYAAVPTAAQQQQAEPKLGRRRGASKVEDDRLGMGAGDVPLDQRGMPTGPGVVAPGSPGVGDDGYRHGAAFFDFGATEPLTPGLELGAAPAASDATRVLKRGSGVALLTAGMVGQGAAGRRFGIMPSGRFIPTDRLRPALGSTFHGIDLSKHGLPVAFALRGGVPTYQMQRGKAALGDEQLDAREAVLLTGRFRTRAGVRYYFSDDNLWLRHRDIILIPKRNQYPDFAVGEQKWIDVSLANQTLVLWQGHKPLYATLISSGRDRLGDPSTGPSTIQGVFRVRAKHVTRDIDDREVDLRYSIRQAPWVVSFAEGFSLTGCYWRSRFGEALGYHDVSLSPIDAHLVFGWIEPAVPAGWHSVVVASEAESTVVFVHR